jgi:hypothetical protein
LGSKKMQNFCFGNVCTTLVYRSCGNGFALNASILLHWTPNDVWFCFWAFRKPSACKKMQKLCFGPKCTILVYRSCRNGFATNASILLHFPPNDVWLSFWAFRKPSACKNMQTCVSGLNALFWCTQVAELVSLQMHPFYSIGPQIMFGYLLEHLKNLRHVKRWKTCVSGLNALI